jgi:hypothetical protein
METLDNEMRTHPNQEFCLSYKRAKQLNIVDEWKNWEPTASIKKDNIEEAANKYCDNLSKHSIHSTSKDAFIAGVEWARNNSQ